MKKCPICEQGTLTLKEGTNEVTMIQTLTPCSRYISQLFIDRKYSAINSIMAPEIDNYKGFML